MSDEKLAFGEEFTCPRCDKDKVYRLATSRVDSRPICDDCATEEAMLDYEGKL